MSARVSPPRKEDPIAWPSRTVCRGDGDVSFQRRSVRAEGSRTLLTDDPLPLRLTLSRLDRIGNVSKKVSGDHACLSEFLSGEIASETV